MEFQLKGPYIELMKLLKATRVVDSGGMAKMVIDDGTVTVNGQPELRKRAKLKTGDVIAFNGQQITITSA